MMCMPSLSDACLPSMAEKKSENDENGAKTGRGDKVRE